MILILFCLKPNCQVQPAEIDFGEINVQKAFTFKVKNIGKRNLTWTIYENVNWIVNFQDTSGKINSNSEIQITIKVDRTKLAAGANSDKIHVTVTDDDGSKVKDGAKHVVVKAFKPVKPTVKMVKEHMTEISATTAKAGGLIEVIGSSDISQHGHVWSTEHDPNITDGNDSKTTLNGRTNIGSYQSSLSNLKGNITYYIRAYATNQQGTSYSDEVLF